MDEKTNIGLTKYSEKKHSQYYEDGMIREALESVGVINNGFFVDVGSWDGVFLSNTFRLLEDFNFNGICIEANQDRHNEAVQNLKNYNVKCINTLLSIEESNSLDFILKENNCPKEFDFLSIDIDGIDWWIWESLKNFFPKVVIIEYNSNHNNCSIIHYDKEYVHENNINYYGATPPALNLLANKKNYDLVAINRVNMIFIRRDLNTYPVLDLNEIGWYWVWANPTEKKMMEINEKFFYD
jgi:hypothetical protein